MRKVLFEFLEFFKVLLWNCGVKYFPFMKLPSYCYIWQRDGNLLAFLSLFYVFLLLLYAFDFCYYNTIIFHKRSAYIQSSGQHLKSRNGRIVLPENIAFHKLYFAGPVQRFCAFCLKPFSLPFLPYLEVLNEFIDDIAGKNLGISSFYLRH